MRSLHCLLCNLLERNVCHANTFAFLFRIYSLQYVSCSSSWMTMQQALLGTAYVFCCALYINQYLQFCTCMENIPRTRVLKETHAKLHPKHVQVIYVTNMSISTNPQVSYSTVLFPCAASQHGVQISQWECIIRT